MRPTVLVIACVLALVATGGAQEKPKGEPSTPTLTEVQQLRLQNLALQAQTASAQIALLQTVLRQIDQERETQAKAIEAEHPGWTLNRETGRLERQSVKK